MVTIRGMGCFVVCAVVSGCAQQPVETDTSATVRVPDEIFQFPTAQVAAPEQPRLADLLPQKPEVEERAPPMATFSRYDGRAPEVAVAKEAAFPSNKWTQKVVPRVRKASPVEQPVKAIEKITPTKPKRLAVRSTPAPAPRPMTSSPRPMRRPAPNVSVAAALLDAPVAVLPPRPVISVLASRSMKLPAASRDLNPTGLPITSGPEAAIPIGALPASLGLANLQAAEAALPIADTLEQSNADESGTLGWDDASALVRAGEVESAVDIGEFEVLMTLCSGRGIITIQPTPGALAAIASPKVICGKSASLTSQ